MRTCCNQVLVKPRKHTSALMFSRDQAERWLRENRQLCFRAFSQSVLQPSSRETSQTLARSCFRATRPSVGCVRTGGFVFAHSRNQLCNHDLVRTSKQAQPVFACNHANIGCTANSNHEFTSGCARPAQPAAQTCFPENTANVSNQCVRVEQATLFSACSLRNHVLKTISMWTHVLSGGAEHQCPCRSFARRPPLRGSRSGTPWLSHFAGICKHAQAHNAMKTLPLMTSQWIT